VLRGNSDQLIDGGLFDGAADGALLEQAAGVSDVPVIGVEHERGELLVGLAGEVDGDGWRF